MTRLTTIPICFVMLVTALFSTSISAQVLVGDDINYVVGSLGGAHYPQSGPPPLPCYSDPVRNYSMPCSQTSGVQLKLVIRELENREEIIFGRHPVDLVAEVFPMDLAVGDTIDWYPYFIELYFPGDTATIVIDIIAQGSPIRGGEFILNENGNGWTCSSNTCNVGCSPYNFSVDFVYDSQDIICDDACEQWAEIWVEDYPGSQYFNYQWSHDGSEDRYVDNLCPDSTYGCSVLTTDRDTVSSEYIHH